MSDLDLDKNYCDTDPYNGHSKVENCQRSDCDHYITTQNPKLTEEWKHYLTYGWAVGLAVISVTFYLMAWLYSAGWFTRPAKASEVQELSDKIVTVEKKVDDGFHRIEQANEKRDRQMERQNENTMHMMEMLGRIEGQSSKQKQQD